MSGRIYVRLGGYQPDRGYVHAEVQEVHAHSCGAWRIGTRHAPCSCGADEAWKAFLTAAGDQPWRWLAENADSINAAGSGASS